MHRIFIFLSIFSISVLANETKINSLDNQTFEVKIGLANVRGRPNMNNKYLKGQYKLDQIVKIEFCDKYQWCKIKDKNLYIAKTVLNIVKPNKILKQKEKKVTIKPLVQSQKIKKKICIKLKKIDLNESKLLSKETQNNLFLQYQNKCIEGKLLKNILDDISKYYINNGYITTKPYLEAQDILDGQIDIKVITGIIHDIVDAKTSRNTSNIRVAFPFFKNKPLNLQELETSLEMVNRVPSVNAKFDIKPGEKQGTSLVIVKNDISSPYHINIGVSGEKSLKDTDPHLTSVLSYDNPFNINDIISYTYNSSLLQKEYQSTRGYEYNYSFSLGSYLLELIYSNIKYRQSVEGFRDQYLSSGTTKGKKLKISKVLARNQKHKLNLSGMIYHKNTNNYFDSERLDVSSYSTTLAQIDLTHSYFQNWGQLTSTYSVYQGKNWFGARDDEVNSQEKLEFLKHTLRLNLLYYFLDKSYKFDSIFYLQNTNDLLYNNDQLSVGSNYTVRGYSDSNLLGNNGYYLKNTFTKTYHPQISKSLLQSISIFTGIDYGTIKCESNSLSCGKIYGSAIGITTDSDNIATDFTWSRPLTNTNDTFKKQTLLKYNLTLKF